MQEGNNQKSFKILVDQKPHEWPEQFITGAQIKGLAGVDPATYDVWQDIPGPEDVLIADNDPVDLSVPGRERFFTGKKTTTEGFTIMNILPSPDREYLEKKNFAFKEIEEAGQKGIILEDWILPSGKFDAEKVDVLVLLPQGYADIGPDMFFLFPWVKLIQIQKYPRAADQGMTFLGKNWQRWSRHNSEWRSGIDGIWTMIKRIENAVMEAS